MSVRVCLCVVSRCGRELFGPIAQFAEKRLKFPSSIRLDSRHGLCLYQPELLSH